MKISFTFAALVLLLSCISSCGNNDGKKVASRGISTASVSIYYFHFTKRCATCLAVEENARKTVEEMFPNEVRAGDYSFESLNLEEAGTREVADKLAMGGQSLVIVHGNKKIDITGAAWLAAHDPEKMKAEIKSGVDKVLF